MKKPTKAQIISSLDPFTRAYIIAGLWSCPISETNDSGIDSKYGIEDMTIAALNRCVKDCKAFQEQNERALNLADYSHIRAHGHDFEDSEFAGHDFWLTRNRHGAGFWDRGLRLCLGRILTSASHAFGDIHFYVQGGKVAIE
jgi:hypothetical protein